MGKLKPICIVAGCERVSSGDTYCRGHLRKFKLYGNAEVSRRIDPNNPISFWARVTLTADDSRCWVWRGAKDNRGYGRINVRGTLLAHRYAWLLVKGRTADGLLLHSCDNPSCVNPNHLREGTMQDNVDDAYSRNRMPVGERHYRALCTDEQVREIRRRFHDKEPNKRIATSLNLPYAVVAHITSGRKYHRVSL